MKKTIYSQELEAFLGLFREMRVEAGLRQEDLAKLIEEDQSSISRYESGQRRVDVIELWRICQAMGCSFTDFTARLDGILSEMAESRKPKGKRGKKRRGGTRGGKK